MWIGFGSDYNRIQICARALKTLVLELPRGKAGDWIENGHVMH